MICPKCGKKISFTITEVPLPMFDFHTNKWFHQPCYAKMQLRKRTVKEQKAIAERQKLLNQWSSF